MNDLIKEARELIEALHAGEYDDEYIGTGAYLMLDELCDALEKATKKNKELMRELSQLARESIEREKVLAKLEAEVMAVTEPKRGEWIYSRTQSEFAVSKCSACGKEQFSISHVVKDGNYCPNCGANMEDKP